MKSPNVHVYEITIRTRTSCTCMDLSLSTSILVPFLVSEKNGFVVLEGSMLGFVVFVAFVVFVGFVVFDVFVGFVVFHVFVGFACSMVLARTRVPRVIDSYSYGVYSSLYFPSENETIALTNQFHSLIRCPVLLACPQINASSPNIAILLLSLLGPTNMQHPE